MLHLKLAAIDFEKIFGAAVEDFSESLDGAGFPGTGGAEEKKYAGGTAFGGEGGLEHLDVGDDLFHGSGLADDAAGEVAQEVWWTGIPAWP